MKRTYAVHDIHFKVADM